MKMSARTLLGFPVVEVRPVLNQCLLQVTCRDCKKPLQRTYAAVYTAQKEGRGCICADCLPQLKGNPAKKLDAHRERLIEKHAKSPNQETALRSLLRNSSDDEPLRISTREFWTVLAGRAAAGGMSIKTAALYQHYAFAAMGLTKKREGIS